MQKPTDDIETVMGIGKKLATDLKSRGFTTRKSLLKIVDELPIAARMDLQYKPMRKIPHDIIKDIDKTLKKIFSKHKCIYMIAGSYRRKKPFSKDIDVLVDKTCLGHGDPLPKILSMINKSRVRTPLKIKLISPYSSGADRISALFQVNKSSTYYKVDFFIVPRSEWVPAVVYATGSQQFNIRMRSVAKRKGWKLNQRGLYDENGNLVPVSTEQELFDILNITYKTPQEREV